MRRNESEAIELLEAFARGGVIIPSDVAKSLVTMARNHRAICVIECNGETMPKDSQRKALLEASIRKIVKEFRLIALFGGDPRGFTVKIHSPTRDVYNTWGGAESGYGIGEAI